MQVRFWGVRGSLPAPLLPSQVKSKISSVLARLTPHDLESPESRERFLASLPPWLFGTVGGNTPCVTVKNNDDLLVFDCGSGIRELGLFSIAQKPKPTQYHVFLSHFHWDHLQGIPFFTPAYDPSVQIDFYSPLEAIENAFAGQMAPPWFPVQMDSMGSTKKFHRMEGTVALNSVTVDSRKMNHPGAS